MLILLAAAAAYYLAGVSVDETAPKQTAAHKCADDTQDKMVWIPAGSFTMGSADYYPEEGPLTEFSIEGFWMDRYEVTNAQFANFVAATGYVTVAERQPQPEDFPDLPAENLMPGSVVFIIPTEWAGGGSLRQWWQFIPGANWRQPAGPGSDLAGKAHYPVVHIAYEDARSYADWLGHELPTEAQWEYAARGGLEQQTYSWGEEFRPADQWRANTWQGLFPLQNTAADGYAGAAPVGCYPANGYGLHDMTANVWEWVANWYYPRHVDEASAIRDEAKTGFDPRQPGRPVRVIKGGSYLCAENYCLRYRPAARHAQESSLGAAHIGFRTVKNGPEN